uniref:Uncharacterized protein n=2 Tax=Aegilops tauschii subsp. strangulata TaxID=200361 RepID=A0A452ZDT7_AEGTS
MNHLLFSNTPMIFLGVYPKNMLHPCSRKTGCSFRYSCAAAAPLQQPWALPIVLLCFPSIDMAMSIPILAGMDQQSLLDLHLLPQLPSMIPTSSLNWSHTAGCGLATATANSVRGVGGLWRRGCRREAGRRARRSSRRPLQ